jgi:predicted DCC family thiol-disulfide oxidoreductase YuxK
MIRHSIEVKKPVVLFDGFCNYCSRKINFMAKHDTGDHFLFSASQTDAGKKLLKTFSIEDIANESVILIEKENIYIKSTAALRIYRHLNGLLPVLYIFIIIPRFIRDAVYDVIARNRYKWFGKRETCMVPDEKMKEKFLE